MPEIKEAHDKYIKAMLKGKDITIMCDERTNRKGEAVFITMFKILPSESNAEHILIIPSMNILLSYYCYIYISYYHFIIISF